MKRWQIFSIIALFVASIGLSATASHADEIEELKKRLKFLEAKNVIVKKLDNMQSTIYSLQGKIDGFQNELDGFRVKYDLKTSTKETKKGKDGKVGSFNDLMSLMENKEITLTLPHGDRPMKVTKENGKWQMEQTAAGRVSEIVSDGKNRIKMEDYPFNWVINGTWEFSKSDNKCQINHIDDKDLIMVWKC